jgi:hypothetical protein
MAGALYEITTTSGVLLTTTVAKCIIGARAHANSSIYLSSYEVSFDGITASAVPVTVDICRVTFATNPPGTASTPLTPDLRNGRSTTLGWTAAFNWTAEPTVVTPFRTFTLTPNGGAVFYDFPLQLEPDTNLNEGFAIRCTSISTPNVRAAMVIGRC